jgi:two-component system cell cycle sensor histidine kinase/response regulator CckA
MSAEGTGRQLIEAVQRESEERFRAIFSQAAVGMAQVGLDGKWLLVNSRFCEMLGYSEAEVLGKTWQDITHPDDRDKALAGRRRLLAGEISSHTMEKRYLRKDGTVMWGRLYRSLVRDHDNLPRYVIAVLEDITEKVQAERALRDSERRLTLAQSAAHLVVWEWDLHTNVIVSSGERARLYGFTPDHPQLKYEEWLRLVHPDDRERVQAVVREAVEETHVLDAEFRVLWLDGSVHWLESKGAAFFDDSGRPIRLVGVNFDITDRKQADAALYESEQRFRNMADAAPVMIWVSGSDKLCTFFNKGWLTFTGRTMEEVLGNGWTVDVHPDDLDRCYVIYSSSFDARRNFQMEYRLHRADGEYRWVLDIGAPRFSPESIFVGYIGSCVDITELRRTQEEALARQKLESLGVLAGGVAHDFNNLLGGILAEAELAETYLAAGSSPAEDIQVIKAIAIRAAEIVRELMIFSGQDKACLEPVNISRLVEEMLELLKVSISKHAVLKTDLRINLPPVMGNAAQIRQIVMNLVINASEAVGEKAGVISVSTSYVTGGKDLGQPGMGKLPQGDYVRLRVSDTGCGMTEEAKAKIFDPFFTSKFAGRGLGLAVVQGIVRTHGGTIDVWSAPGRGATFQVLLPCTSEGALAIPDPIAPSGAEQSNALAGTILVVEDEEFLRLAVSKALRQRGFSVMAVSDGSAAIDLLHAHKDDIDVILLDVTLPGRSSREVVEEAHRVRADLTIILTSAYGKETVDTSFTGLQVDRFIRKPFHLDDLMAFLQKAIARH